jgi:hypothetical protein
VQRVPRYMLLLQVQCPPPCPGLVSHTGQCTMCCGGHRNWKSKHPRSTPTAPTSRSPSRFWATFSYSIPLWSLCVCVLCCVLCVVCCVVLCYVFAHCSPYLQDDINASKTKSDSQHKLSTIESSIAGLEALPIDVCIRSRRAHARTHTTPHAHARIRSRSTDLRDCRTHRRWSIPSGGTCERAC